MRHVSVRRTKSARAAVSAPRALQSVEDLVSHRIITLANLLRRSASLRYRRAFGLALIEWRIVAVLGEAVPVSLNALAHRVGLSKSQMSRGVAGLVRKRLMSRAMNASDNREIALALTAQGRALYLGFKAAANERNRELTAAIREPELRRFRAVIDRLTETAESLLRAEIRARGPR